MMYGSWHMEREGQSVLSFWVIFCPFTPQFAKSKFWKNEKKPGDIIVLQKCTINDDHIMHGSWDMEYQGRSFLSFWTIFCSLTPLKILKMKILKKRKNTTTTTTTTKMPGDNIILRVYSKWQSYDVSFLRLGAGQTFFVILDHFLPF